MSTVCFDRQESPAGQQASAGAAPDGCFYFERKNSRKVNRFFAKMAQKKWRGNGGIRPRAIFAKCRMHETASGGAAGYGICTLAGIIKLLSCFQKTVLRWFPACCEQSRYAQNPPPHREDPVILRGKAREVLDCSHPEKRGYCKRSEFRRIGGSGKCQCR